VVQVHRPAARPAQRTRAQLSDETREDRLHGATIHRGLPGRNTTQ
jgi:hypothetical protein